MTVQIMLRRWGLGRIVAAAVLALLVPSAQAAVTPKDVVIVEMGTHQLLRERLSVSRIAVGDPAVADVNVINRNELLITGKSNGVTSLLVWYKETKQTRAYRLVIKDIENPLNGPQPQDAELGQAQINPGQLSGELPNLEAHSRAVQQAGDDSADRSTVNVGTQVLTEIKIAELSRSTLRQFGFNFLLNRLDGTIAVTRPGTLNSATLTPSSTNSDGDAVPSAVELASAAGFLPLSNAFNIVLGNATKNVLGYLSMLENQGLVRTLAQPSLVAMTGQTATFLAGGEFPIPVSQGGTGGISIEYKEFGVRLALTPTVLGSNRIALKVAPEVSELDFSAGVQVSGTSVPALTVRRTDTTVELGNGESFVISGLISRNMITSVDKVPFLGSIPFLGAFFKSSRYDRDERELIMVVTPHLVEPLKAGAKVPDLPGQQYDNYKPDSFDLIFGETGRFKTGYSR
ncbi:MAG: type II and III secretion system protein family protein [Oceanococcus sp.]|nr:MAG: type II and III secretion system protein family protein [Oceanococcus sp.]